MTESGRVTAGEGALGKPSSRSRHASRSATSTPVVNVMELVIESLSECAPYSDILPDIRASFSPIGRRAGPPSSLKASDENPYARTGYATYALGAKDSEPSDSF